MYEENVKNADSNADEKEYGQHERAIEKLVQELGVPVEEVNRSYHEILELLKKEAKVRVFLPVIVSRLVKERLRQR